MDTVDSSLLSFIFSRFARGEVFFAEDLEPSGFTPEEIRFSLSRLVQGEHGLARLARGVYCVPIQEERSGRLLMPAVQDIAAALSRRWRVRIAPCGASAAHLAGFTGLDMEPDTWVSDGSEQVFHLQNGRCIRFRRRKSNKVFDFRSERMRNLCEGMKHLGKDYFIQAGGRGVVSDNLSMVSDDDFVHDIRLCPGWVREILRQSRD